MTLLRCWSTLATGREVAPRTQAQVVSNGGRAPVAQRVWCPASPQPRHASCDHQGSARVGWWLRVFRTGCGRGAQSQVVGEVREQDGLIRWAQQLVARLEIDPAGSASEPDDRAGTSAGPAAAPPIDRMIEQQRVHHRTGPDSIEPISSTAPGPACASWRRTPRSASQMRR
jgi:hypothetical protein